MRVHTVINACSPGYQNQIKELRGWLQHDCREMEPGLTYILCKAEQDKEALAKAAPFDQSVFILLQEYHPETVLQALSLRISKEDCYLFASDYAGQELAVRLSGRWASSSAVGVTGIRPQSSRLYVKKPVYSNHMEGEFVLNRSPYFVSVAKGVWEGETENTSSEIYDIVDMRTAQSDFRQEDRTVAAIAEDQGLEQADFILVAGRGAGTAENIERLKQAAETMGAKFSVSRPAAMNAWAPMEQLVGVSGAVIKPKLCITVGVSGAAALYAGIEKSKCIIAVNTDEKAPIMKKADISVHGDGIEIIEALANCMAGEGEA